VTDIKGSWSLIVFERYTEKARRAIFFARYEASQYGSSRIEPEHLLLGLLREHRELGRRVLISPGSVEAVRAEIAKRSVPSEKIPTSVDLPLSEDCKRVLKNAVEEADRLSHKQIGCEHLLIGLLREEKSFAAEVLLRFGISLDQLRQEAEKIAAVPPTRDFRDITDVKPIRGIGELYRAQGALWGAGYVRKSHAITTRTFHWERRLSEPRDALVKRADGALMLYRGDNYDAQEFDLVKDGWKHDHCVVCWKLLYNRDHPDESFGYTNGEHWLCQQCYDAFLAGA
jgi:Clp amino terminal domain, pathogenicity island component